METLHHVLACVFYVVGTAYYSFNPHPALRLGETIVARHANFDKRQNADTCLFSRIGRLLTT